MFLKKCLTVKNQSFYRVMGFFGFQLSWKKKKENDLKAEII